MRYKLPIQVLVVFALILGVNKQALAAVNNDTDRDGYPDQVEIANNYDAKSPCGKNLFNQKPFAYGVGRLTSAGDEKCRASFLQSEINRVMGKKISLPEKQWFSYVNAFIYGGYSVDDVVAQIRGRKNINFTKSKNTLVQIPPTAPNQTIFPKVKEAIVTSYAPLPINSGTTPEVILAVNTYDVAGFIQDASTDKPLAGVRVRMFAKESGYININDSAQSTIMLDSTLTDKNGYYQIFIPAHYRAQYGTSSVLIQAYASDYFEFKKVTALGTKQTLNFEMINNASESIDEQTTLYGKIIDATTKKAVVQMSTITIFYQNGKTEGTVTYGTNGFYQIRKPLPAGAATFRVMVQGTFYNSKNIDINLTGKQQRLDVEVVQDEEAIAATSGKKSLSH